MIRVCAFTGHRRITGGHTGPLVELLDRAIEYAYGQGCRVFLSGGAVGFDTLAARRVLKFRMTHPEVRLELVLPCINQDERWNDVQRDAYEFLLRNADAVRYVTNDYTDGCMKRRNEMLAEEADIVVAYVTRPTSGAAQTVRMAEKLGRLVYNLYPSIEGARK